MAAFQFRMTLEFAVQSQTEPTLADAAKLHVAIEKQLQAEGLPTKVHKKKTPRKVNNPDENDSESEGEGRDELLDLPAYGFEYAERKYDIWKVSKAEERNLISSTEELKPMMVGYAVSASKPRLNPTDEAIKVIERVCDILRSKQKTLFWNGAMVPQVIISKVGGYSHQDVKNFLALVWTFESQFDTLHPPPAPEFDHWIRRQGLRTMTTIYRCGENRFTAARTGDPEYANPPTTSEQLDKIFARKTSNKVVRLVMHLDPYGTQIYDLRQLYTPIRRKYGSSPGIIFEQHEATLDHTAIRNWIKLCLGMVQFTREDNPIDVPAYLRSHAEDVQYSVISIINDMGLPEQAEYYKTVVKRRLLTR
ncbi:hypothetical protein IFR04_012297 [Cadophora malorum]|uniref:Uncharacterized protein n=1 Tax=Cadophora malorum TaxID=108018 RepID=A0A8H7T6X1_9HELO|nr:hypothetical protein IFR04_012297 [Cadophora malorum]